ncbi:MAG TPA: DUF4249 family protein [Bacteroidota bacterium]|nr:DUF4249 family protein [Bacteroidota bacterium]
MKSGPTILIVLALVIAGCNQPFEPNGPLNSTLVIYSVLSSSSDTQYVRLSTTFASPPEPAVKNAVVTLTGGGTNYRFRDTTVLWRDTLGNLAPTNVYVAYNARVQGGVSYTLHASTPEGLSASATISALPLPFFAFRPGTAPGFFDVSRTFKTQSGAAILHFYLDYYAYEGGGWVLHTEEIPTQKFVDGSGSTIFVYPSFSAVATLAAGGPDALIDSTLFQVTRSRVLAAHLPGPVVYLDIRFVLTQIDEFLYDYYYVYNAPVDNSSIRLDVPEFTNIHGGLGVFGSRAEEVILLPLAR